MSDVPYVKPDITNQEGNKVAERLKQALETKVATTLVIEIKRFIDHVFLQVDPLHLPCSETVDVTNSTLVAYLK